MSPNQNKESGTIDNYHNAARDPSSELFEPPDAFTDHSNTKESNHPIGLSEASLLYRAGISVLSSVDAVFKEYHRDIVEYCVEKDTKRLEEVHRIELHFEEFLDQFDPVLRHKINDESEFDLVDPEDILDGRIWWYDQMDEAITKGIARATNRNATFLKAEAVLNSPAKRLATPLEKYGINEQDVENGELPLVAIKSNSNPAKFYAIIPWFGTSICTCDDKPTGGAGGTGSYPWFCWHDIAFYNYIAANNFERRHSMTIPPAYERIAPQSYIDEFTQEIL